MCGWVCACSGTGVLWLPPPPSMLSTLKGGRTQTSLTRPLATALPPVYSIPPFLRPQPRLETSELRTTSLASPQNPPSMPPNPSNPTWKSKRATCSLPTSCRRSTSLLETPRPLHDGACALSDREQRKSQRKKERHALSTASCTSQPPAKWRQAFRPPCANDNPFLSRGQCSFRQRPNR